MTIRTTSATLLVLLALWQAAASLGWISTTFLSTPIAIGRAIAALATSGELWANLSASLHTLLQILSLTLFEKLDLAQALTPLSLESQIIDHAKQQNLFDL